MLGAYQPGPGRGSEHVQQVAAHDVTRLRETLPKASCDLVLRPVLLGVPSKSILSRDPSSQETIKNPGETAGF